MRIPGFVEFSNLRPVSDTIVYVPYYMPVSNPNWTRSDEDLLAEAFGYLKLVNPTLTDADLLDARVGRLAYAQPVCQRGFAATIPKVQTAVQGLQIADTCFYYPEDRGISESVRYGARRAQSPTQRFGNDNFGARRVRALSRHRRNRGLGQYR